MLFNVHFQKNIYHRQDKRNIDYTNLNPAFNDYLPLKGKLSRPRVA